MTNPGMYLSACADKVKAEGYTVLHSIYWRDYKNIDIKELTQKIILGVDAFYLFVDYGISVFMIELINRFYSRDQGFSKEIKIEVSRSLKQINLEGILSEVSGKANIPVETLKMKTRKREIVEARQIYFKRAKRETSFSLASIGALVGKDHATVLHGIKTVNNVKELSERYYDYFGGAIPLSLIKKKTKAEKIFHESIIQEPIKRLVSPYADVQSCTNQPYHGYRTHAL